MALWVCQVHLVASIGLPAMFLIAICTAVFYGVLLWTIYLALEPFVRTTLAPGARLVDQRAVRPSARSRWSAATSSWDCCSGWDGFCSSAASIWRRASEPSSTSQGKWASWPASAVAGRRAAGRA